MSAERRFKWIKVGGLLGLIPIVLAIAPLAGYMAGDWLVTSLGFPRYTVTVCVIIGFVAAASETIRIIAAALNTAKKED